MERRGDETKPPVAQLEPAEAALAAAPRAIAEDEVGLGGIGNDRDPDLGGVGGEQLGYQLSVGGIGEVDRDPLRPVLAGELGGGASDEVVGGDDAREPSLP